MSRRSAMLLTGFPLAVALVAGCVEDERDEAVEETEEFTAATEAETVAEALRAAVLAEDLDEDEHADDVLVLRAAVEKLPGNPDIGGIDDDDGDGRDDDGRIEVHVDDDAACVSFVDDRDELRVTDDAC